MYLQRPCFLTDDDIPIEAIEDCTHRGDCYDDVDFWVNKLDFNVNVDDALNHLKECGLDENNIDEPNKVIFWVLCHNLKENGIFEL